MFAPAEVDFFALRYKYKGRNLHIDGDYIYLDGKDQFVYLDGPEADELEEGKIDAAANIPLGQLIRNARHVDIDFLKTDKIITYCSSGYRGNIAEEGF